MNKYNYSILIILTLLILLIFIITQENFVNCKIINCTTGYTLSNSNDYCCYKNDDNAAEYTSIGTSCTLSKCNTNYYVQNEICVYCNPINSTISNDGKKCCPNITGAIQYGSNCEVIQCNNGNLPVNNCICIKENDINKIMELIITYWNTTYNPGGFKDIIIYDIEKFEENAYQVLHIYKHPNYVLYQTELANFYYEVTPSCKIIFNKKLDVKTNNYTQIIKNIEVKTKNMIPYKFSGINCYFHNKRLEDNNGIVYFNSIGGVYSDQQQWMFVKNRYFINKYTGNYLTIDTSERIYSSKFDENLNQAFKLYESNYDYNLKIFYIYNYKTKKYLSCDNTSISLKTYSFNNNYYKWQQIII